MSDCLFCAIVAGEIPAEIVAEGDEWLAFRDIQPQAPVHVLVVPRRHIATLNEAGKEDTGMLGELVAAARRIADEEGIAGDGYRLVINTNADGGQAVYHVHLHVLGGRAMTWPPG